MKQLRFISGNKDKFQNASQFMRERGIELKQEILHLNEIQSESSQEIALTKAHQAFNIVKSPLFVNDASWHIPSLGGFPGPFMKYMVKWLTMEDVLALMDDKVDRTIILRDTVAFSDGSIEKIFVRDVEGVLLKVPRGEADGPFITQLISFTDDGKSLAEVRSAGFTKRELPLWEDFAGWFNARS